MAVVVAAIAAVVEAMALVAERMAAAARPRVGLRVDVAAEVLLSSLQRMPSVVLICGGAMATVMVAAVTVVVVAAAVVVKSFLARPCRWKCLGAMDFWMAFKVLTRLATAAQAAEMASVEEKVTEVLAETAEVVTAVEVVVMAVMEAMVLRPDMRTRLNICCAMDASVAQRQSAALVMLSS